MATDTRHGSHHNYANVADFDQPHWKIIAAGLDTEKWFNEGRAEGTGGILMPKPTRMPSGNYYYRFASSTSARPATVGWAVGGFDFEASTAIKSFARSNGYRLKDAVRLMLALPYDWTKVDLLIKALLKLPLCAYTGVGKPAQGGSSGADRGTKWIPTQHIKVRQLYVPGLFVKGRSMQLNETVFVQPPQTLSLKSWSDPLTSVGVGGDQIGPCLLRRPGNNIRAHVLRGNERTDSAYRTYQKYCFSLWTWPEKPYYFEIRNSSVSAVFTTTALFGLAPMRSPCASATHHRESISACQPDVRCSKP